MPYTADPLAAELLPEAAENLAEPRVRGTDVIVAREYDDRWLLVRAVSALGSAWEWCFGVFSILIGLAILASIPVVQFLSLGYLLEASARIARSGRLRDGFVGIRKAARVGSLVAGTFLMLLPLRFISDLWTSAQLIDPASPATAILRALLVVLSVLVVAHILWAWFRGGRLRHFFWPAPIRFLKSLYSGRNLLVQGRDATWEFVAGLRLPYYFWLGVRGFFGALAWLFLPIAMLIAASYLNRGPGVLLGLTGAVLLATVLLYLPFLQTHFALENRFAAIFELQAVRRMFRRAPIAYWFALLITLAFALPLYLLKIELIPREAAWIPSLVFVAFAIPARFLTGWAVGRSRRREKPRFFLSRWLARFAAVPVVLFYVLIVYFTRYFAWHGSLSLFEQHAFLLPVPFLGQ